MPLNSIELNIGDSKVRLFYYYLKEVLRNNTGHS